jgi:hypothetical protein
MRTACLLIRVMQKVPSMPFIAQRSPTTNAFPSGSALTLVLGFIK